VNRDQAGKFGEKTGSAPSISLAPDAGTVARERLAFGAEAREREYVAVGGDFIARDTVSQLRSALKKPGKHVITNRAVSKLKNDELTVGSPSGKTETYVHSGFFRLVADRGDNNITLASDFGNVVEVRDGVKADITVDSGKKATIYIDEGADTAIYLRDEQVTGVSRARINDDSRKAQVFAHEGVYYWYNGETRQGTVPRP